MEELQLKEVEVAKLSVQEGDVLMVVIKHDYVEAEAMLALKNQFAKLLPNNQIAFFVMGSDGDIKFNVVKSAEVSYCSDCSCGKKQKYEKEQS